MLHTTGGLSHIQGNPKAQKHAAIKMIFPCISFSADEDHNELYTMMKGHHHLRSRQYSRFKAIMAGADENNIDHLVHKEIGYMFCLDENMVTGDHDFHGSNNFQDNDRLQRNINFEGNCCH